MGLTTLPQRPKWIIISLLSIGRKHHALTVGYKRLHKKYANVMLRSLGYKTRLALRPVRNESTFCIYQPGEEVEEEDVEEEENVRRGQNILFVILSKLRNV